MPGSSASRSAWTGPTGTPTTRSAGEAGAFDAAVAGLKHLRALGVSTQINTSVARHNVDQLPDILKLAQSLGSRRVSRLPAGPGGLRPDDCRGADHPGRPIREVLNWFYDRSLDSGLELKATCAPHYYRIMRQRRAEARRAGESVPELATHGLHATTRGCLAGSGVCFISHQGEVYPCGYLPIAAGDLKKDRFRDVWEKAEVFAALREPDNLEGKCGLCEFKHVCLGCRARAYGMTGNYLAEEPFCIYEPATTRPNTQ